MRVQCINASFPLATTVSKLERGYSVPQQRRGAVRAAADAVDFLILQTSRSHAFAWSSCKLGFQDHFDLAHRFISALAIGVPLATATGCIAC
jgi:hypothetical protein